MMTTLAYGAQDGWADRYGDRRGCGDELYMDARFKSRAMLAELGGIDVLAELESADEQYDDDAASH